jgi:flagellar protein FlgJ
MMNEKNLLSSLATVHINQQYRDQRLGNTLISHKKLIAERAAPELHSACREMESLFINYLLKEMRATVHKSGFISGGQAEEIFTSMLDVELSRKTSAAGGIGLSSLLLEQLGGKTVTDDSTEPQ